MAKHPYVLGTFATKLSFHFLNHQKIPDFLNAHIDPLREIVFDHI
jgi:hypothetical protein